MTFTVIMVVLSRTQAVESSKVSLNAAAMSPPSSSKFMDNIDSIVESMMSNSMDDALLPPVLPSSTRNHGDRNDIKDGGKSNDEEELMALENIKGDSLHENGYDETVKDEDKDNEDTLNKNDVAKVLMALERGNNGRTKVTDGHLRRDNNDNENKRQLLCNQRCQERNLLRNRLKSLIDAAAAAKYRHQQLHSKLRRGSKSSTNILLLIRNGHKDQIDDNYDASDSGKDKDTDTDNNQQIHKEQKRHFVSDDEIKPAVVVSWMRASRRGDSLRRRNGIRCNTQCQQLERLRAKLRTRIGSGSFGDTIMNTQDAFQRRQRVLYF